MANIPLHKNNNNSTTEISNRFIDEYMTNANGEFVKIYLYLLRCMNSPNCSFSISKTADKFDHTEKDIQRALKYWEKMNLIHLEYDENNSISGIYFLESETASAKNDDIPLKKVDTSFENKLGASSAAIKSIYAKVPMENELDVLSAAVKSVYAKVPMEISAQSAPIKPAYAKVPMENELSTPPAAKPAYVKPVYSINDIGVFREKEEVQELLFIAENYLGRPLTSTDIQTLLYWYDELNFSSDLIIYLLEYCIANGHSNLNYMEKIALSWKDANIETVAQAKNHINTHNQLYYAVIKALGIHGRNLIPAESAYIEKWSKEFGFGQDIIAEACSRTILAIQKPNFEYIDRILSNWQKQNIRTIADVHKADEAFQTAKSTMKTPKSSPIKPAPINRFNNFPQRTYNMEQLEAELLNSKR